MKTLLAIINVPAESMTFIRHAMHLARDLHSNVHFTYILNPDNFILGVPGAAGIASTDVQQKIESLTAIAKTELAANIQQAMQEKPGDVMADYSIQTGTPSIVVKDMVNQGRAVSVVLEGEKDMHFWSQSLSNLDVIRNVDCPVWVIPYKKEYKAFQRIIYATDYKEEDVTTLKRLLNLTRHFMPEITALHITDSLDFEEKVKKAGFLEMLRQQTAYKRLSVKVMAETSNKDVISLINDYALSHKANLVVLLRENRHFLDRIFSKDKTKQMLEHSALPILIFHEKE